jgi:O-antigen/teichoic acid export membrane protein
VQGIGRPDLTAKLHLIELPLYLLLLILLLNFFGTVGAALAWTGRVVIDTLVLLAWARRDLSFMELPVKQLLLLLASVTLLFASTIPLSLPMRIWILAASLLGHGALSWGSLLTGSEREIILDRLGHFCGFTRRA